MNAQLFDQARAAYRSGNFSAAAQMFASVKDPGEVCGEVDHLRGNSLMRLGMWGEAAAAYALAQHGQELFGRVFMHEADLASVAHARAAALGVFDYF